MFGFPYYTQPRQQPVYYTRSRSPSRHPYYSSPYDDYDCVDPYYLRQQQRAAAQQRALAEQRARQAQLEAARRRAYEQELARRRAEQERLAHYYGGAYQRDPYAAAQLAREHEEALRQRRERERWAAWGEEHEEDEDVDERVMDAFRRAAPRRASPPRAQQHHPHPQPTRRSPSPPTATPTASAPAPAPAPAPSAPAPTAPADDPTLDRAARTLQSFFRTNADRLKSYAALRRLRGEFESLCNAFVFPDALDFDPKTGKLAFTPRNRPMLAYEQSLLHLLEKLDAVETHGDLRIRQARKQLVNDIESELRKLDESISAQRRAASDAEAQGEAADALKAESTDFSPSPAPPAPTAPTLPAPTAPAAETEAATDADDDEYVTIEPSDVARPASPAVALPASEPDVHPSAEPLPQPVTHMRPDSPSPLAVQPASEADLPPTSPSSTPAEPPTSSASVPRPTSPAPAPQAAQLATVGTGGLDIPVTAGPPTTLGTGTGRPFDPYFRNQQGVEAR